MPRAYLSSVFLLWWCVACDKQPNDVPPLAAQTHSAKSAASSATVKTLDPLDDSLPVVGLDGTTHPHSVTLVAPGKKRVYSRAPRTWVHESASKSSARLGYLRAGGSAPLSSEPTSGPGCAGGWAPILPRGFICLDASATLDGEDPVVAVFEEHPPDFSRKLPYIYGTVRKPGPIYSRLPTAEEVRKSEPGFEERINTWLGAEGEIGASFAQHVWLGPNEELTDPKAAWDTKVSSGVPDYLGNGQILPAFSGKTRSTEDWVAGRMASKVGHAFLQTFLWEGRRYGVSTGLQLMPTDRYRPIQGSDYKGVEIGKDVKFPFAIVRVPGARFRSGKQPPYRAALQLTGKQQFFDQTLHYETREGEWISDRNASRLDPAKNMPGWGEKGEKWIDVSLTKQTLVLYEGTEPVFATLISSGEAGLEDPEHTTATKRGIFRIHTKHVTATMSSREIGEEFELQDVPYVMYFDKEGYALHGAYWHDRFGTPKSHGCLNLSPEDARRIFHWTEPKLPAGWHGVLKPLTGTVLFIHP